MRLIAALLAILAATCLAGAAWLWLETDRFFRSADYAPHSAHQPGYSAGAVEADGSGIFLPSLLLFGLGLFLARFAWNLWRDEGRRRRAARGPRGAGPRRG